LSLLEPSYCKKCQAFVILGIDPQGLSQDATIHMTGIHIVVEAPLIYLPILKKPPVAGIVGMLFYPAM